MNRQDVLGRVRRFFDLLAKLGDEIVDGARRRELFVAPDLVEDLLARDDLSGVLHEVAQQIEFAGGELDALIDAINASGYGLTLGVHTRIDGVAAHIAARAQVGNVYVNRNQIGAIVGSQPFGGRGLSGTGPKAGGPHYLHRFAEEKSISTDITAAGGNAALMAG